MGRCGLDRWRADDTAQATHKQRQRTAEHLSTKVNRPPDTDFNETPETNPIGSSAVVVDGVVLYTVDMVQSRGWWSGKPEPYTIING